ncbi:hypothetical protein [Burkholderia ubonensis]|nr:hypothetical protein [Burkholderia ubonensis]KVP75543.1 hypothetical protein WJ93_09295 [Burkholderia ubonensis]
MWSFELRKPMTAEEAIAEALSYGTSADLAARHLHWLRTQKMALFYLPFALLLADLLMFLKPSLLGNPTGVYAQLCGVIFCVLPMLALASIGYGHSTPFGYWCVPLNDPHDLDDRVARSPGAKKLRDAILASGRELHYVDEWLMGSVIHYEYRKTGVWPAPIITE